MFDLCLQTDFPRLHHKCFIIVMSLLVHFTHMPRAVMFKNVLYIWPIFKADNVLFCPEYAIKRFGFERRGYSRYKKN